MTLIHVWHWGDYQKLLFVITVIERFSTFEAVGCRGSAGETPENSGQCLVEHPGKAKAGALDAAVNNRHCGLDVRLC